ncbi:MAG: NlpC/P60 family protein [Candidatus Kapaibacterium sp.]|nr:MAG: NlpC/P60 family protein [Candidatus Kapabacteria bacterium]
MHRWKSTLWMVLTGFIALCILIPSLPLQAALKLKKKATGIRYKKSHQKHKRHVRSYHSSSNTVLGKIQALAFLQSSRELSGLAALQYQPDPNLQSMMDNDGEDMTDELNYEGIADYDKEALEDDMSEGFSADVNSFQKLWMSYMKGVDPTHSAVQENEIMTQAGFPKQDVMAAVMDWIGTPYYYGGNGRGGIDCSAFTRTVYKMVGNITMPRTAAQQSTVGEVLREGDKLQLGDLVFFNTRSAVYVSHVGMYLGDNLFAHASSRFGVTVSSLQANYYRTRFIGARRLRPSDIEKLSSEQTIGGLYGEVQTTLPTHIQSQKRILAAQD